MNINEKVIDNEAKLKLLEIKMQALLNILYKEGELVEEDFEKEVAKLSHAD